MLAIDELVTIEVERLGDYFLKRADLWVMDLFVLCLWTLFQAVFLLASPSLYRRGMRRESGERMTLQAFNSTLSGAMDPLDLYSIPPYPTRPRLPHESSMHSPTSSSVDLSDMPLLEMADMDMAGSEMYPNRGAFTFALNQEHTAMPRASHIALTQSFRRSLNSALWLAWQSWLRESSEEEEGPCPFPLGEFFLRRASRGSDTFTEYLNESSEEDAAAGSPRKRFADHQLVTSPTDPFLVRMLPTLPYHSSTDTEDSLSDLDMLSIIDPNVLSMEGVEWAPLKEKTILWWQSIQDAAFGSMRSPVMWNHLPTDFQPLAEEKAWDGMELILLEAIHSCPHRMAAKDAWRDRTSVDMRLCLALAGVPFGQPDKFDLSAMQKDALQRAALQQIDRVAPAGVDSPLRTLLLAQRANYLPHRDPKKWATLLGHDIHPHAYSAAINKLHRTFQAEGLLLDDVAVLDPNLLQLTLLFDRRRLVASRLLNKAATSLPQQKGMLRLVHFLLRRFAPQDDVLDLTYSLFRRPFLYTFVEQHRAVLPREMLDFYLKESLHLVYRLPSPTEPTTPWSWLDIIQDHLPNPHMLQQHGFAVTARDTYGVLLMNAVLLQARAHDNVLFYILTLHRYGAVAEDRAPFDYPLVNLVNYLVTEYQSRQYTSQDADALMMLMNHNLVVRADLLDASLMAPSKRILSVLYDELTMAMQPCMFTEAFRPLGKIIFYFWYHRLDGMQSQLVDRMKFVHATEPARFAKEATWFKQGSHLLRQALYSSGSISNDYPKLQNQLQFLPTSFYAYITDGRRIKPKRLRKSS